MIVNFTFVIKNKLIVQIYILNIIMLFYTYFKLKDSWEMKEFIWFFDSFQSLKKKNLIFLSYNLMSALYNELNITLIKQFLRNKKTHLSSNSSLISFFMVLRWHFTLLRHSLIYFRHLLTLSRHSSILLRCSSTLLKCLWTYWYLWLTLNWKSFRSTYASFVTWLKRLITLSKYQDTLISDLRNITNWNTTLTCVLKQNVL